MWGRLQKLPCWMIYTILQQKKKRETTRSETGEAGLASEGLSKVPEIGLKRRVTPRVGGLQKSLIQICMLCLHGATHTSLLFEHCFMREEPPRPLARAVPGCCMPRGIHRTIRHVMVSYIYMACIPSYIYLVNSVYVADKLPDYLYIYLVSSKTIFS